MSKVESKVVSNLATPLGSNGAHWVLNPKASALDVPATAGRLLPVKGSAAREARPAEDGRPAKKERAAKIGAAEYLGVNRRTVFRLMESGELRPVRLPGVRRLLFDVRDLDALIEKAKG